jgi:hypothetical protein
MISFVRAEADPFDTMREETMAYFRPLKGEVISTDGGKVIMSIDSEDAALPHMRFNVLRKGEPFYHPVTKELLGRFESIVGKVELEKVLTDGYAGFLVDGEAAPGDALRISGTKIKMFFCQSKDIDWHIADEYYRRLKETGRIEMLDSSLETNDKSIVLEEAKKLGAEVALLMTARSEEKDAFLKTQLFWVRDGARFYDREIKVDAALAKDLKIGEEYFIPQGDEVLFSYDLPMDAKLLATGDFDGNGASEIALSNGENVKIYMPSVDLQFLWELDEAQKGEHIWIDSIDLNRNGKDELVITVLGSGRVLSDVDEAVTITEGSVVISYLYELSGTAFQKMWEGKYFMRSIGDALLVQAYSPDDGFSGHVYTMKHDGTYQIDNTLNIPENVNIYDFVFLRGDDKENIIFAYDDNGFLNLYNETGIRTWRSRASTGGFIRTFKKRSAAYYLEPGEWVVKDRLIQRFGEILVVERIPLLQQARGIGFKSSRIKRYWWNGFSMENSILINDIAGTVLDFAVADDKMLVLSNPLLGIKFKNILKGKSPLGTMLFMYSIKGR